MPSPLADRGSRGALYRIHLLSLSAAALALSACGGGSSSPTPPPPPPPPPPATFQAHGVAAGDKALEGSPYSMICADGSAPAGMTGTGGSWSYELNSSQLPCLVQVNAGNGRELHSVVMADGVTNITGLTEMVLARALHANPADVFTAATAKALTPAAIATAQADVRASLQGMVDVSAFADFISTPFTAETLHGVSNADAAGVALAGANTTLDAKGASLEALAKAMTLPSSASAINAGLQSGDPASLTGFPFGHVWDAKLTPVAGVNALWQAPQLINGEIVLLGRYGIMRSKDRGSSWQLTPLSIAATSNIVYFQNQLVVADGTRVYASADMGHTWSLKADLPTMGYLEGVPNQSEITGLYVASSGQLFAEGPGGGQGNPEDPNTLYRNAWTSDLTNWNVDLVNLQWRGWPEGQDWKAQAAPCSGLVGNWAPWNVSISEDRSIVLGVPWGQNNPVGVERFQRTGGTCTDLGFVATNTAPVKNLLRAQNGSAMFLSSFSITNGDSGVSVSTDNGLHWTPWPSPSLYDLTAALQLDANTMLTEGSTLQTVNWGGSLYFGAGATFLQSSNLDGTQTRQLLPTLSRSVNRIASFGNTMVAVAGSNEPAPSRSGTLFVSQDRGTNWHETFWNQVPALTSVAVGDSGRFVAVGKGGTLVYGSGADSDWHVGSATTSHDVVDVAWGNGKFLAVLDDGETIDSADGIQWSTPQPAFSYFANLSFGSGRFVAVEYNRYGWATDPNLMESLDGRTWTSVPGPGRLQSLASCNGGTAVVAVGDRGFAVRTGAGWQFSQPFPEAGAHSVSCANGVVAVTLNWDPYLHASNAYVLETDPPVWASGDLGQHWKTGVVPYTDTHPLLGAGNHWFLAGEDQVLWMLQ